MIAQELEVSLHKAFVNARSQRHQVIGVEHLLLALLDAPSAVQVLRACGADLGHLRKNLTEHIAANTPLCSANQDFDTQPTLGFQRIIQRAILKVQASGRKEVVGADVLLAILAEKKSPAASFLERQAIAWLDAANYVSHGITKVQQPQQVKMVQEVQQPQQGKLQEDQEGGDLQVVLYNDDFTPMAFVVRVLEELFGMSREDATEAMLEIHRDGMAVCGLYSQQAAEELVEQVLAYALEQGHPLRCAAVVPK
jgi:ATP-dependent Clp protease adapter protein ClpS